MGWGGEIRPSSLDDSQTIATRLTDLTTVRFLCTANKAKWRIFSLSLCLSTSFSSSLFISSLFVHLSTLRCFP